MSDVVEPFLSDDQVTKVADVVVKAVEPSDDEPLREPGKRALDAEREANRALKAEKAELAEKLQKLEDRDKSEEQKRQEAFDAAVAAKSESDARAAAAEKALIRFEVATDKGIPSELVGRLVGETREELEADADKLLEFIGEQDKPRRPAPVATLGNNSAVNDVDNNARSILLG